MTSALLYTIKTAVLQYYNGDKSLGQPGVGAMVVSRRVSFSGASQTRVHFNDHSQSPVSSLLQ